MKTYKEFIMESMNLQYQLSNGKWTDVGDRTDEFLSRCMKNNGPDASGKLVPRVKATRDATREEVLKALESGKELKNDKNDWYSNCRDSNAIKIQQPKSTEMVKCSCGHTVSKISVMNSSRGTSCPDCYDRMSD